MDIAKIENNNSTQPVDEGDSGSNTDKAIGDQEEDVRRHSILEKTTPFVCSPDDIGMIRTLCGE